jgi:hypothetical protein
MKTILLIVLYSGSITWTFAQDKILSEFEYKSFQIDNSSDIESCIISKKEVENGLEIKIFSHNACEEIEGFAILNKDTIDLYFGVPNVVDTQYVYIDSASGKTMYYYQAHVVQGCCNGYCGYELAYIFQKEIQPKIIRLRNEIIENCIDHTDFQVLEGDTTNMLDRYGLKQGDWVEYFPNHGIKKKENYSNGRLINGIEYNEKGKIISRTSGEGEMTITILE